MSLLNDRRRDILERTGDVDRGAHDRRRGAPARPRLRSTAAASAIAMRLIPPEVPAARQAGAAGRACATWSRPAPAWCWSPAAPGGGKTTTLAALIDDLDARARLPRRHHRGSGRDPAQGPAQRGRPARGRARRPDDRGRRCARPRARTPTCSSSASCATARSAELALAAAETGRLVLAGWRARRVGRAGALLGSARRRPARPRLAGAARRRRAAAVPRADGKGRVRPPSCCSSTTRRAGCAPGGEAELRRGWPPDARRQPASTLAGDAGARTASSPSALARADRPAAAARCQAALGAGSPRTRDAKAAVEDDARAD